MSSVQPLLDAAGRRRSLATTPGFRVAPRSLLCQGVRRPVGGFAGVLAGGDPLTQARCRPAEASLKRLGHAVQWIAIGTEFGSRRRL